MNPIAEDEPDLVISEVEYGCATVDSIGIVVGMRALNGSILAVKRVKECVVGQQMTGAHVFQVNPKISIAFAGLLDDGVDMCRIAKGHALRYFQKNNEFIELRALVEQLKLCVEDYNNQGAVRPFGVTMFVASAHKLFKIEPIPVSLRYYKFTNELAEKHRYDLLATYEFKTTPTSLLTTTVENITNQFFDDMTNLETEYVVNIINV